MADTDLDAKEIIPLNKTTNIDQTFSLYINHYNCNMIKTEAILCSFLFRVLFINYVYSSFIMYLDHGDGKEKRTSWGGRANTVIFSKLYST